MDYQNYIAGKWVDARGGVRFDYKPVTMTTLTDEVKAIPPKARTY